MQRNVGRIISSALETKTRQIEADCPVECGLPRVCVPKNLFYRCHRANSKAIKTTALARHTVLNSARTFLLRRNTSQLNKNDQLYDYIFLLN
jgi:hypothetical protein